MNPIDIAMLKPPDYETLPATGERFLPEQMLGDIELEHMHRYAIALNFAAGKNVLDIASGEGYGSNLLASVAESVIGVDISNDAVCHATRRYVKNNLKFKLGRCDSIPLGDHSIDLVVSFETLEHHDQHTEMLMEIKRVLKSNGVLIISTPDKHEYSDCSGDKNHFHVKELYLNEFSELLSSQFANQKIYGQRIYHGSMVSPIYPHLEQLLTISRTTDTVTISPGMTHAMYYLAVASDVELPFHCFSILDGTRSFLDTFKNALTALAETRADLEYTRSEIMRIKGTFSWKITKPLRLLINLPRFIFRKFLLNKDENHHAR